jgi:hypothetical protein
VHDELGKKRKNRTKELEAQKARIVAQMAPVKEEEKYELENRNEDPLPLPESKEIKRPSVKENRVPGQVATTNTFRNFVLIPFPCQ